jgi:putative nucleotidyltransferase with HDIG domain
MKQEQLDKFKIWFNDYVACFYGDDRYINANIKLKDDHSRRVCDEMLYLADELNLNANQRLLAETIALFHDIGRFEQFKKYQTYHDPRSINHCLLGVQILRQMKLLDCLDPAEKQLVEKAIEYHGAKEIPGNLASDCLLYCQMIRDADKIDIFLVMTVNYKRHRDDPDNFDLEVELPDEPRCTPEILEAVLAGEKIDYAKLQTWNDMKLCNLAWVYDANFVPTLKRIRQKRYIELVLEFLPDTPDIRKVRDKIFSYIDSRIKLGA